MTRISLSKADLSVDNVHTPFGLTKQPPPTSPHSTNEPEPDSLSQVLEGHVALSPPTHEEV